MPKASDAGVTDTVACVIPVPDRLTFMGRFKPLPVTWTDVVREPVAVGLNVTFTVQNEPGASNVPQLWASRKSPAALPPVVVNVTPVMIALPSFARVNVCAVLSVSSGWLVKVSDVTRMSATGWVPVPDSCTAGEFDALLVIVSSAGADPLAEGVNVTLIEQLVPGVNGLGHGLVTP